MAQRSKRSTPIAVPPTLLPLQAAELLNSQFEKGTVLLSHRPITSGDKQAWETVTRDVLIRAFGSESPNVNAVMDVGRYGYFGGGNEQEWEARRADDMETRLKIVAELIELLHSSERVARTRPPSQSGQALPFEIDRFPQTIKERVPDCDPVIIRFVEEAIRCIRAEALLGCAFMIGAASERAIGLVMQVFGDCIGDEGNRAKYFSKINNRMISKKFEEFSACYKGCKSRPTDPALSQDLDVLIGSTFQFCRITRNEVGHPQIVPDLDKGVLLANLGHLVTYLDRIYGLIHHFQQTGVVL